MEFTPEELKNLRASLPRGAAKMLAKQLGLVDGSVRNILSGGAKNSDVLLAAVELAKLHRAKIEDAKAAITSL
ncbi:hypothetical protein [Mucilaginibacter sp.]|uniref:hypothetical protein n=1 Tax=Mucilaginibacter sp. TaxID=1882438 RepID=UPI0025D6E5AA|nr:hypothetical protein [Mucilaginibacter sp.]